MRWTDQLWLRLRSLFHRLQVERELDAELRFHLDQQTEENLAAGMPRDEARFAALRAIGGVEQIKEECRNMRRMNLIENLVQDLRYAIRMLLKSPGFTTVAVLSLALGIGANTSVFSLLNTLLLTKLPVRDPDGLYQLIVTHRSATHNKFSYPDYRKLRDNFDLFDGVIAWHSSTFEIEANNSPLDARGAFVTGAFYQVLGIKPALGRLIEPSDDTPAGSSVAVLGYSFWERTFARDPNIAGKVFRISGAPFTIIGVTPREFTGAELDHPRDVTVPAQALRSVWRQNNALEQSDMYWLSVMVRLKPGVSMESARPALRDLWPKLLEADGFRQVDGWTQKLNIQPGASGLSDVRNEFSDALIIVMALVALVLLLACANIANLLLARATGRRKEIAIRLAIGAGRMRLVRQWLTESLLLSALGGCAGVMLAQWITQALLLFLPKGDVGFLAFHLDMRMLLFAATVTVATALLFGLLPALHATQAHPGSVMKETSRASTAGRRPWLARGVVVAQVAVCLVLVIGALLFARSLQNLSRSDLGFQRDGLLLVDVNPAKAGYKGDRASFFFKDFLNRLNTTPAFRSAASAFITPLSGNMRWGPVAVPGYIPAQNEMTTVYMNSVSPRYFATMGTPVLAGREFTDADDRNSRRVVIVNESFARRFFQGGNAIGRKFTGGNGTREDLKDLEIVGVVANTKYGTPREKQKELIAVAIYQGEYGAGGTILARLAPGVSADGASAEIRKIAAEIGKEVPVEIRPYSQLFERVLQQDRMVALLSALFGFLAMTLACVGLYGVMAYAVNSRRGEIGIRMALGATRGTVVRMILGESLFLGAIGAAIGIPVALLATRFIASYLFGLTTTDPPALLSAILIMVTVATVAGYLPARVAASLDPVIALRNE